MVFSSLAFLTSCKKKETKADIPIYISELPTNFDPAFATFDASGMQFIPMIYEGLFAYDSKGNPQKALAEDYEFFTDSATGERKLEIIIRENYWNDGSTVNAGDFMETYKRILDPFSDFACANLLFFIKNAKDYHNGSGEGKSSREDLGITAETKSNAKGEKTQILTLTLEPNTAYTEDLIISNLASLELSPIKSSKASSMKGTGMSSYDWSTFTITMLSNGPYYVKSFTPNKTLVLARNPFYVTKDGTRAAATFTITVVDPSAYYQTDTDGHKKGDAIEGVTPRVSDQLNYELYQAGEIYFDGALPVSPTDGRTSVKGATVESSTSTLALQFNLRDVYDIYDVEDTATKTVLGYTVGDLLPATITDQRVREALSIAIDRNALADTIAYSKSAEGIIPSKIKDYIGAKKTFRDVGGTLIASSADISKANQLLKDANFNATTIKLAIKANDPLSLYVANEIKQVWEALTCADGKAMTVEIHELGVQMYSKGSYELMIVNDLFYEAVQIGAEVKRISKTKGSNDEQVTYYVITGRERIDVFLVDLFASSADVFGTLATYAPEFSGMGRSASDSEIINYPVDQDYPVVPHYSGVNNSDFNALIASAYSNSNLKDRAETLHNAEKVLINTFVICPLLEMESAYVANKRLKNIEVGWYGNYILTFVEDKTYKGE